MHGTTTDNEQDLATGQAPGELSARGIKEAIELGNQVADQAFDVIFCSDLKRSIDSARLGFEKKYPIVIDQRLRECDYGDFTGKPSESFKNRMAEFVAKRFPNGESYSDVENRIADFLIFLKQNYCGKRVGIVCHQAPQLALEVLVKGRTWKQAINEDWRKRKAWQPGWKYELNC